MSTQSSFPFQGPALATVEITDLDAEPDVQRVVGREAIGQPFTFDIDLVLPGRPEGGLATDVSDLAGQPASLIFQDADGGELRRVDGILSAAEELADGQTIEHPVYRVTLSPLAWQLTLVELQEIFLDLSIPEIIGDKLERVGLGAYVDSRLLSSYPSREFVVQYGETDLAFISRLAEHWGISFFFDRVEDEPRLVLCDHLSAFPELEPKELPFLPRGEHQGVYQLSVHAAPIPKHYAVHDYNYRAPQTDLSGKHEVSDPAVGGVIEWGTHHDDEDQGTWFATVRAEERLANRRFVRGESACCIIEAGRRLTVDGHPRIEGEELLVTEVTHELVQLSGFEGGRQQAPKYLNRFRAVPTTFTYRPPRLTPRPRIAGVVNGIVEGAAPGVTGGFAHMDDSGRYRVEFSFDTMRPGERKASRPVRMTQPFSGSSEGMHFPLRPGTEVILAFVNGDPDRPVIVGTLPNPLTASPVTARDANKNRITTGSGAIFEIADGT